MKFENSLLNDKYNSLVKILKLNGVVMYIENNKFNVKDWDNLNFVKPHNLISIETKDGEIIYTFDEINSRILNKLLYNNNSYSIIIMRVTEKLIKINFRIK